MFLPIKYIFLLKQAEVQAMHEEETDLNVAQFSLTAKEMHFQATPPNFLHFWYYCDNLHIDQDKQR